MKKEYAGTILRVVKDGLADELGLTAGDKIIAINGENPRDIIDVSFAMADEEIELLVEHIDGEREIIAFDKDYDEELGVEFQSAVFDGIRSCRNNCCFCFIDMIAPSMRNSLSIKDDDYRLSFLYGNFITLTNLTDKDYERIEKYHLSPLYVSVQCTNPELRAKMLRYTGAGRLMEQLERLEKAGVEYHTQIVLCRGLNDGEELERSIEDIVARRPYAQSLAIVPVGITKYRRDPFPLEQFDAYSAGKVIDAVSRWQEKLRSDKDNNKTFIYLGDEFYFLAGRDIPPADYYDGFPQLDNGIGLTRNFIEEWQVAKNKSVMKSYDNELKLAIISGTAIAPVMQSLADEAKNLIKGLKPSVLAVENKLFGKEVNVSGLLTGRDIINNLKAATDNYEGILIPASAIRLGENILLDDITLDDVRQAFPDTRVEMVAGGSDYWQALTNWHEYNNSLNSDNYTSYTWQSNAGYTKP